MAGCSSRSEPGAASAAQGCRIGRRSWNRSTAPSRCGCGLAPGGTGPSVDTSDRRTMSAMGPRPEVSTTRIKELEDCLRHIIDVHHRTLVGSSWHKPDKREWTDCDCMTCKRVKELLPNG